MRAAILLLALLSGCAGPKLAECTGKSYALNGENTQPTIWDDGSATYIRFAGNTPIPAISYKPADGQKEAIAPHTVQEDGLVVVHGVYPEIRLRSGDAVACLQNKEFNPIGVRSETGTSHPDIERMPLVAK